MKCTFCGHAYYKDKVSPNQMIPLQQSHTHSKDHTPPPLTHLWPLLMFFVITPEY